MESATDFVRDGSGRPFVRNAVAPGSVVHTDGWSGYRGLAAAGYQHQVTVISDGPEPAHEDEFGWHLGNVGSIERKGFTP